MLARRDEYQAEYAQTAAQGFVRWYNAGLKSIAASSAEDVVTAGLNMLFALQAEGVTLESADLAERLRRAANIIDPTAPTVLVELDRGDGTVTRVEDNGDGTEDVVSLQRDGRELERYTRPGPERRNGG
jgi:hypothetical protein